MRVETSSRLSLTTETFSIEAMVREYHVYQDSWDATIGEQLPLGAWEPQGSRRGSGETVGRVPKKILSVCSMFLLRGGTIHCRGIASGCWLLVLK